jgi:hypothetical protein
LVAPVVAVGVDVVAAEDVVVVFADDGDGGGGHQDQYGGVCVGAADAEVVQAAAVAEGEFVPRHRSTPERLSPYQARPKASPPNTAAEHFRIRHDVVDRRVCREYGGRVPSIGPVDELLDERREQLVYAAVARSAAW